MCSGICDNDMIMSDIAEKKIEKVNIVFVQNDPKNISATELIC